MNELEEDRYKIKGSKDLWECVEGLEAIARWMRDSTFDYELRDLKRLFTETMRLYNNYLYEKTDI